MQGNWGAAISALAPMFIGMIGMFVVMSVLLIVGIRIMTKDKIFCTFHRNHRKAGALLKYDAVDNCVWLGKADDPNREKYDVNSDDVEWVDWPGMLPSFFCVTIRSLDFVRNQQTPVNVEKKGHAVMSAKAYRLQSDANVLQAVYLHARTALGLNKGQKLGSMITILLVAAVAMSLFTAYKTMQMGSQVSSTKVQLETIQNALGIITEYTAPTPTPQPYVPSTGGK